MRGKLGDLIIGFFVVVVTALFLLPIPTTILDLFLVFNLGFSVLLLLVVLFVSEPSKLFVFPAVLLVSTLFRLGLNVGSTRLILLDGYAGDVIQSFGQFLVRGEVIVGLVIFAIITVVNYIVVAKGAARVAEVAARFTLDGLPVKQMAIESDMRAGLITNQEAMQKREELRRESQLYGSMDGAMKFIQGDVIAGILIIFANIFGGLYLGLTNGMGLAEAGHTYTILTVGDGLVSQIPSLMGAFCAGIVVTRVSAGTGQTLSGEVFEQILGRRDAWMISSMIMLALSFAPGTPTVPFLVAAVSFLICGKFLPPKYAASAAGIGSGVINGVQALPRETGGKESRLGSIRSIYKLELDLRVFGSVGSAQSCETEWSVLKSQFQDERGIVLPELSSRVEPGLHFGGFRLFVEGVEVLSNKVPSDARFYFLTPEVASSLGLNVIESAVDPLGGLLGSWLSEDRTTQLVAEAGDVPSLSQIQFALRSCAAFFVRNPEKLISVADCFSLIKSLSQKDPGLVGHVIDSGLLSVPRLAQVLQRLVRDGLFVGNIRSILEDIAGLFARYEQPKDSVFTVDEIVAAVRAKRVREILARITSIRGGVRVITIGPNLTQEFEQTVMRDDSALILGDRAKVSKFLEKIEEVIAPLRSKGYFPVGVCCNAEFQSVVSEILKERYFTIPVVSLGEAAQVGFVEELGVWEI